mgnify:FL=1
MTTFIITEAAFIIFLLVTMLWVVSVFIKNVSIVDIFWGIGFVVVNTVYFLNSGDVTPRKILLLILVSLWGFRLAIYLAFRNIGKGEDFRYQEFRLKFGPHRYWWLSYFQTFLLQGGLILIISLPLLAVNSSSSSGILGVLDYVGICVWIIGFLFEAGGDYQLYQFKKHNDNKTKILKTGFWKYTRHPNYFGDSVIWWAYAIFSIAAGGYWQIMGSVIMTLLIVKVSGVSLLEKTLKTNKPGYQDYIKRTNAFFPWFPKNKY